MFSQMPRRVDQSSRHSVASPLEHSFAIKEGDIGEGRKHPDGTHLTESKLAPSPITLEGGTEPAGLFTLYLKASTEATAQGWDALQNQSVAPVLNERIWGQGDGSAGKSTCCTSLAPQVP